MLPYRKDNRFMAGCSSSVAVTIANTIPTFSENDIIIYTTPGNGMFYNVVINNHKYTRNRLLMIIVG